MHFLIFLFIFTEQPPRRDLLRLRVHFLLALLRAAVEAAGEEDRRLGGCGLATHGFWRNKNHQNLGKHQNVIHGIARWYADTYLPPLSERQLVCSEQPASS